MHLGLLAKILRSLVHTASSVAVLISVFMFEGYIIISRLLLGFMVTTMTLSMWISNTATTAMMTPIVKAVLDELKQVSKNTAATPFYEVLLSTHTIHDLSNIKCCSYSNSVVMYIGVV